MALATVAAGVAVAIVADGDQTRAGRGPGGTGLSGTLGTDSLGGVTFVGSVPTGEFEPFDDSLPFAESLLPTEP
jgi:hypothetical protein